MPRLSALAVAGCGLVLAAAGDAPRFDSVSVTPTALYPPLSGNGYAVSNVVTAGGPEKRLYLNGHHFASILTLNGICALRPHPGVDRNGWGSTLYLQPFIANAVLGHASVLSCAATSTGILVNASGDVSWGSSSTYGAWTLTDLLVSYAPSTKRMAAASGSFAIDLAGPISGAGGDLNLFKLASNFLDDVPLLDGSIGDTGDMRYADCTTDAATFIWVPPDQPGHFPGPATDLLSVTAVGCFNDVDTLAQSWTNYHAIQAAYKPSLRVQLNAHSSGYGLIPGFRYATNQAQHFDADNIGITPVVLQSSPFTHFAYSVSIEAWPLAGDGSGVDVELSATLNTGPNVFSIDAYFTEELSDARTNRFIGALERVAPAVYEGSLAVPRAPWSDSKHGFFRLKTFIP